MADFSEVIKQFKRLCKSVNPMKCTRGECLMGCENIGQCRKVAFERPAKFEEQVMAWAAEHPVVYPTWYEWLTSIGAVTRKVKPDVASNLIETGLLDPIPADIAEKLGIEPKEDV